MSAYVNVGDARPGDVVPESISGVNPFDRPGEWLKCALHTHSTNSDGTLSPQDLVRTYDEAGFDVVAITDHWRLTEVDGTDRTLTLPAAELGWDVKHPRYPRQSAEFLAYGIDHIPDDPGGDRDNWYVNDAEHYEVRTFPDLTQGAEWAASMGAVVYVAHPYWTHIAMEDLTAQEGFAGLEVFNGSSHIECGRGDASVWWDELLGRGRRTFGIATDDQHNPLFELGTAWTMVKATERSREAVLDALRSGFAYLSHGPEIHHIDITDDAIEVHCSPATSVLLQSEEELGIAVTIGRGGKRQGEVLSTDNNGQITSVRFDRGRSPSRYARITIMDAQGRRAWSNPI
ncbi:MAG TPA: PHP domain-containing protein [Actinomycetes bacterium]|nr:PHP domain-containing protein [Actinomycetes bacterium]